MDRHAITYLTDSRAGFRPATYLFAARAVLAREIGDAERTKMFARYSPIGALEIAYDAMLLVQFRHVTPPEER